MSSKSGLPYCDVLSCLASQCVHVVMTDLLWLVRLVKRTSTRAVRAAASVRRASMRERTCVSAARPSGTWTVTTDPPTPEEVGVTKRVWLQ